ncbi:MAG TPA: hypothetical protein VJ890_00365 [Vineibacter sp.]|nr:hypothetical protein [Vineibacter sp.]
MVALNNFGRMAAATIMALGIAGCSGGTPSGGISSGGGFVESFDPTGSALAAAYTRPTREADVETVLAAHIRTAAFLQQYPATRQKAGCAASGPCNHRVALVQVDGRGKPLGETPSCGEINAQLDSTAGGQVALRGVTWTRRSGRCGG